ncbi:MAG: HrpE/YscL family type III secretion apparatus protein [Betaproteobacteria bacterium]|jgi:type III secretion protein L|nr:HrpE/YscL family type III secretion apparatus protein [Betaproteobacteria bacterium]
MKFVRLQDLEGRQWDHIDPAQVVLKAKDVAVWTDAQALLERARSDAERIRLEATQAFESEKSRGYEEGLQEARLEQTERMIENATRMVEFFASVEQRMVGLVMDAVRRIIADYSDAERVMAVVRSGLHVMRNQKQLTLRLAPEHAPQVSARAAELLQSFPGIGMLDIVPDSRLKGDAAILESEIGVVEASIDMQMQALEHGFQKMLGSRQ